MRVGVQDGSVGVLPIWYGITCQGNSPLPRRRRRNHRSRHRRHHHRLNDLRRVRGPIQQSKGHLNRQVRA